MPRDYDLIPVSAVAGLSVSAKRFGLEIGKIQQMSRLPSNRSAHSFVELALIIVLLTIVMLSILLILGDDLRTFINDLLQTWFPG
jgi:flagellar biosynthesis protein FlhB